MPLFFNCRTTELIPFTGEFSPEVLEFLEKHDNVEYISENSKMTAEDNYEITTQKYGLIFSSENLN